ncbi:Hypothetical protein EfmE4452_0651 [Enterococcus faecium E4452]|nr:Hypothetical protein EfmE4452_0651 [Enterococcus faecium E4452]
MRCRNHNTGICLQITSRKRYCRNRKQFWPQVHLNTICSKDVCGSLCKHIRFDTGIIANHHGSGFIVLIQIVCQTLACLTYGVYVHAISACTDGTTQTTSTERQIFIERVLNVLLRIGTQFFYNICIGMIQPTLIFYFIIHIIILSHPETESTREC